MERAAFAAACTLLTFSLFGIILCFIALLLKIEDRWGPKAAAWTAGSVVVIGTFIYFYIG